MFRSPAPCKKRKERGTQELEKLREERVRADRFNLFCTDLLGNELIMRNPSFRVFAETIKEVFADLDGAKDADAETEFW
jgi:hypothetical protein